jgi:hypothetical protein
MVTMHEILVVFGIALAFFLLVIVLPYYLGIREAESEM